MKACLLASATEAHLNHQHLYQVSNSNVTDLVNMGPKNAEPITEMSTNQISYSDHKALL